MARIGGQTTYTSETSGNDSGSYKFALSALTSLFFMWGFITCLNDLLIPKLKVAFDLSYTEAMLIQFCFFGAYAIVSIPAGRLVNKLGYQKGLVVGLLIAAVGCTLFYPAAVSQAYPLFLGALLVLASGIVVLQVAANPYVAALGASETASSRLTLTQAFNSLGTTVAPFFGAALILGTATAAVEVENADSVKLPYLLLAGALVILAIIFSRLKLPVIQSQTGEVNPTQLSGEKSAWSHRHLVLGAIGVFVYIGAEVSIGSFLVIFLGAENIAGMEESEAAKYIAYYWGGAMVGRFIGAAVMQRFKAGLVLCICSLTASSLVATAIFSEGSTAMWAILSVGLFNSIMFPTIFTLAVNGLGHHTSQGSGILCFAIVGGAILPVIHGVMADLIGLQNAFILPIIYYLYIAHYGIKGSKIRS
jgi:FHS family L-fucose permease-like MFS transporter